MNRNINISFKIFIPYINVIVLAYFISSIIFIFLPKSGTDILQTKENKLDPIYYTGFYSNVTVAKVTKTKIDKKIDDKKVLANYILKGIYSLNLDNGWIIIEDKNSKKSIFLEHNEFIDGYKLINFFYNYVVFEKNQKEYKLELPKEKHSPFVLENNTKNGKEKIVVNSDGATVSREYLNTYVNNVQKIWNDIAIKDIRKNGKIEGFKIEKVNVNSVFGKLGLKENDIIRSVNGTRIRTYSDAFKVYNDIKLSKLDYLTLDILRDNKPMELNYEIN